MKKQATMDEKIQRINELYHKSQKEGLRPLSGRIISTASGSIFGRS